MNRFNMLKRGNTEGTGDTKIQIPYGTHSRFSGKIFN